MVSVLLILLKIAAFVLGLCGFWNPFYTFEDFDLQNLNQGETTQDNSTFKLLCYFGFDASWPNNGSLHPALNSTLCTHLIFIGSTDIKDGALAPGSQDDVQKYFSKIPVLKKQNPKLKVLVCNGGGNNGGFTPVLGSALNRTRFAKSAVPFIRKYGFDGLDIDFEFPGWPPLPVEQRKNFTMLLDEIKQEFDNEPRSPGQERLTLSAAVAAGRSVMEIYNVTALAESLDFINLMCYDMHGYAERWPVTDYNAPLYPNDWWSIKHAVILAGNTGWSSYEWNKRGMPKSKIMVGIPTYTHTYTLSDPDKYNGHWAPAKGVGKDCDECTYPWVCNFIANGGTVVFDEDAAVPYTYHGDQWVSYDNVRSVSMKTNWIIDNGFGGIMVYDTNTDDYYGLCDGRTKFPLISAIHNIVANRTNAIH